MARRPRGGRTGGRLQLGRRPPGGWTRRSRVVFRHQRVTPTGEDSWPGCHGVRLTESPFDLGTASGDPIAHASIRLGPLPAPAGQELWNVHAEVDVADG